MNMSKVRAAFALSGLIATSREANVRRAKREAQEKERLVKMALNLVDELSS